MDVAYFTPSGPPLVLHNQTRNWRCADVIDTMGQDGGPRQKATLARTDVLLPARCNHATVKLGSALCCEHTCLAQEARACSLSVASTLKPTCHLERDPLCKLTISTCHLLLSTRSSPLCGCRVSRSARRRCPSKPPLQLESMVSHKVVFC